VSTKLAAGTAVGVYRVMGWISWPSGQRKAAARSEQAEQESVIAQMHLPVQPQWCVFDRGPAGHDLTSPDARKVAARADSHTSREWLDHGSDLYGEPMCLTVCSRPVNGHNALTIHCVCAIRRRKAMP
jgi:hypothetical protein